MRLWYLSLRRPVKAQASLRIRAVSPEPSLFANTKYGSLKNEFMEDEKCHNLKRWLNYCFRGSTDQMRKNLIKNFSITNQRSSFRKM